MTDSKMANKTSRELRLRSALRENLKRRKVQARERAVEEAAGDNSNRSLEHERPNEEDSDKMRKP